MPTLIGQSLGRYHILERLGEGGMATVYKAYDTRLERDVAVKVLRTDRFAPADLERIPKRFEREAKALARLTHPNIVPVIDYGEHEGAPYLVMPYLPGGTLKQRLGKPIPWQETLRLLLPVARALDYAHRQNILHRDVKPSNILITADGEPMLTDFGIAKILDLEDGQTLTATGVGVGTPEYMSPEQGLGKPVDARTDVYSLGVALYEMVTGRKPFQADTPMAVVLMQATEPLPRPTHFVPDLPEAVEKILLKALAKQPEDRYASMAEFAAAMEKAVISVQSSVVSEQSSARSRPPLPLGEGPGVRADSPLPLGAGPGRRAEPVEAVRAESTTDEAATVDQSTTDEAATVDQGVTGETALQEEDRRPQMADRRPQTAVGRPPSEIRRPPSKLWLPLGLLILLLGAGAALGMGLFNLGVRGMGPLAALATRTSTFTPTSTFTFTSTPTHTPTRTPTPSVTPQYGGGLIVFLSGPSYNRGDIWVMRPDGTNRRKLTTTGDNFKPSISPDGSRVAFVSERDGDADIYVVNVDGTGLQKLTNNNAWDDWPSWSPDGSQIAFESDIDGDNEIYIMNADGTYLQQITFNGVLDGGPSWSPDGTKIAFHSDRDGDGDIYILDLESRNTTQLINRPGWQGGPVWSPNGNEIVFDGNEEGDFEIYVIRVDGSGFQALTRNNSGDFQPVWSPDGMWVLFYSDRDGDSDLYLLNRNSPQTTINITNNAIEDQHPSWSKSP